MVSCTRRTVIVENQHQPVAYLSNSNCITKFSLVKYPHFNFPKWSRLVSRRSCTREQIGDSGLRGVVAGKNIANVRLGGGASVPQRINRVGPVRRLCHPVLGKLHQTTHACAILGLASEKGQASLACQGSGSWWLSYRPSDGGDSFCYSCYTIPYIFYHTPSIHKKPIVSMFFNHFSHPSLLFPNVLK